MNHRHRRHPTTFEKPLEFGGRLTQFPASGSKARAEPIAYLLQMIANTVFGNEADTIIANDGRILNGRDGYDKDGLPQNV